MSKIWESRDQIALFVTEVLSDFLGNFRQNLEYTLNYTMIASFYSSLIRVILWLTITLLTWRI